MAFIHLPPSWQLPASAATPESAFWNRRKFLKTLVSAGIGTSATSLVGCQRSKAVSDSLSQTFGMPLEDFTRNPDFQNAGRSITEQIYASSYNNFYEFGGTKNIWENAQKLPTDPWTLEVGGLVQ
ncbi:MAG: protein-methionine-sulfoxide reductase catalytic subunit MsrP, partial [Cyanobacteria bacterium J06636_16]